MTTFWVNGGLVSHGQATVSVMDHGLLYGDGVFEGIRFYNGKAFRLRAHLQRLYHSAAAIRLSIPYTLEELTVAVDETVQAFAEPHGYLRLIVTRGEGRLGLDPTSCSKGSTIIIADHLAMMNEAVRTKGARVVIASTRRIPADGLDPRIKSLNYLNHILARMEASNANADEAILLNGSGCVAEGTADNVFILRAGKLLTPPVSDGALQGITRDLVLELADSLGITADETSLGAYDLYTADECFLTGTGAELVPVREVDQRPMKACPGPVFMRIKQAFDQQVAKETLEREGVTTIEREGDGTGERKAVGVKDTRGQ